MKILALVMTILASETVAPAQAADTTQSSTATRPVTILHVTVASRRDFAATIQAFEKQLGAFDLEAVKPLGAPNPPLDQIKSRLEAMAGSSGFMRFGAIQKFGDLLVLGGEQAGKANQYVIGNPLIALQMVRHRLGVGLYVPLRVLISEDAGVTHLEYDLPSSLLEQFQNADVSAVAQMLDKKLEALIQSSAGL